MFSYSKIDIKEIDKNVSLRYCIFHIKFKKLLILEKICFQYFYKMYTNLYLKLFIFKRLNTYRKNMSRFIIQIPYYKEGTFEIRDLK